MATNIPMGGPIGFSRTPETTQQFALGTEMMGSDGALWVYVKAGEAIVQYDFCTYDETMNIFAGTKAKIDAGHEPCFPQVAFAINEFGWVPKWSMALRVNVLANCAADVPLYTTATAGKLDDDATAQTQLWGLRITTANGGSTASAPAISTSKCQ